MYRNGHFGAALLFYAPLAFVLAAIGQSDLALLGAAVAVALAMLPDYDQRVPGLPHRGPTHTVWFAVVVGVAIGVLGGVVGANLGVLAALGYGVLGFLVGTLTVLSHVAADSLTPMGVRPFEPWSSKRYTVRLVDAGNPIANHVILVLGAAATAGAFALGDWINGLLR